MKTNFFVIVIVWMLMSLYVFSQKDSVEFFDKKMGIPKNIVGVEFSEIPRRTAINGRNLSFLSIHAGRNFKFKYFIFSPTLFFQTSQFLFYGNYFSMNSSNDTVMNTMLYTNYKNKVTSYYVGTDLKTWVCQKIITRKNIYLYESIGVSMFLPLGSVKEMNATVDTFLVKNNSLYFQSRSIINSSKKESPYYYKIRGVDDFNHYFTPHIDLGGIFDVNNIQIVCGFKLYFLTKPYRIYPQDKIIRLNFNVFF